jgi:hypothetical protein
MGEVEMMEWGRKMRKWGKETGKRKKEKWGGEGGKKRKKELTRESLSKHIYSVYG